MRLNTRKIVRCLFILATGFLFGVILAVTGFLVLDRCFPFPMQRVAAAQACGATEILDREGGLIAWRVDAREEWRVPIPLDRVSPWMIQACIAAEDQRFRSHAGVDLTAIARAVLQNLWHGKRVSGASTITMQCIRLLWPRPRTLRGKCVEAFRALQLERCMDKRGIMQLYLNLLPYGGNVIGCEAASRRFFAKSATDLTLAEAALLAGVPQSPARFNPARHLARARQRRWYVLGRMFTRGVITREQARRAGRDALRIRKKPIITMAPRFADFVLRRCGRQGGVVSTSLEPKVQAIVQEAATKTRPRFDAMGIDGLAIVVIDVKQSTLVGMLGSLHPNDPLTGCINATTRPRQPGSLLKPFIYCRAYSLGLLTPAAVVYDQPTVWSGFGPRNIDHRFMGPMSAAQALRLSRNIPAVALLGRVGARRLVADLRSMGIDCARGAEHYGLSLALGTAEVRLIDIANAYACLARMGEYLSLRVFSTDQAGQSRRVYSPGAAWLALRSMPGPGRMDGADLRANLRIAWKTGTSWKQRDAWSVCISPRYVVGVWCGRMSGRGHPALVGSRTALPIALALMARLCGQHGRGESCWRRPASVRIRPVCARSGMVASANCTLRTRAEFLPGISSAHHCRLHQADALPKALPRPTGWRTLTRSGLITGSAGLLEMRTAAPYLPSKSAPRIVSPLPGAEYVLGVTPGKQRLWFIARSADPGQEICWYLNRTLVGRTRSGSPLAWRLLPGIYRLVAATANDTAAAISFRVTLRQP